MCSQDIWFINPWVMEELKRIKAEEDEGEKKENYGFSNTAQAPHGH